MKREDVIQLARECGTGGWQTLDAMVRFGERVAEKAVAEEREACAALADEEVHLRTKVGNSHPEESESRSRCFAAARCAMTIAGEIRARSNT